MSTGLSLRGLTVVYPGTTAVQDVDLDLADGEVLALLGASGSGKSSLLRAVAGLEDVASGQVRWDGRDVVTVPVHRRGFGLMFQDGQLFPFRDVGGNVAYGLAGTPRSSREAVVRRMLHLVGLPGFERRAVSTLSGGQAQRVALARALAPRPRLLLLDEPLSALDRALREQLATDVRTILREQGTTALYVTHDQDEAMTVADRVGIMEGGRLVRVDTPEGLWSDPGSAFVARFLGFGPLLAREEVVALGWGQAWARAAGRAAAGPGGRPGGPAAAGLGGRPGGPAAAGTGGSPEGSALLALAPGALSALAPGSRPDLPRARVTGVRLRRGDRLVEVDLPGPGATAVSSAAAATGSGGPAGSAEPEAATAPATPTAAATGVAGAPASRTATAVLAASAGAVEPGDQVALLLDADRTALVRSDP
ncbi:ABC transporter ATP-binding protein [Actinomyces howellii]|uniref:ABC-type quaternary amine transporter n=1 Tax=Actinomyces howellii TaxID=52771 RepID=A0A3S4RWV3_9ACTO|nr:ABC transporter ATP-binding protein [Actinomyces howellii]VEG28411.1 Fe(3+) ions import ATP-binding protein FbpC 2 [Actinomyces howellii]